MTAPEIVALLKDHFGETIVDQKTEGVLNPFVTVLPGKILDVARFLRDDSHTAFDLLMCLSGMDYTGGKLGVVYHCDSTTLKHKIVLKVQVPTTDPRVQSVESIWKTANWHEREAFDMFGIVFDGHPDLRRILMPDDWEGYPLRKDYEVPEYYHGMKVPY